MLDVGDNGARLGLGASAAGLGAGAVTSPARDLAVDGASECVTGLVLLEHGASHTTVEVGVEDGAAALLGAGGASLGAGSEGSPGSEAAVDGASEEVASLDGPHYNTSSTAEGSSSDDGASALLGTRGTSGRAGAEGRPATNLAVDGALEVVARGEVDIKAACDTTVLSSGHDRLGAFFGTTST